MTRSPDREIQIAGAREHNLRDVTLALPKNRLICFTGVSGSGKSSLAFDTLYAEGQRRYIESLSSYARQFLGALPKPDVDRITGLAPSISIQQKTSGWNPRSTVGTITQIHDYLRVLYSRAGTARCPRCGEPIHTPTRERLTSQLLALPAGTAVLLLAPRVRAQKGEHRELFSELLRQGFVRARVDGELIDLTRPPALDRYRRHDVEVLIDRLTVQPDAKARFAEAIELALAAGGGTAIAVPLGGAPDGPETSNPVGSATRPVAARDARDVNRRAGHSGATARAARDEIVLSSTYGCSGCGTSFEPQHPQMFSFNSPQGMCAGCDGLGIRSDFDPALMVPDASLSFLAPCIVPLRHPPGRWRRHIYEGVAAHLGIDLHTPWRDLPPAARKALLCGTGSQRLIFEWPSARGIWRHGGTFEGIIADLRDRYRRSTSSMVRRYYEQFMRQSTCHECHGARLGAQALAVTLRGGTSRDSRPAERNIAEACRLSIAEALEFFSSLKLDRVQRQIAEEPLKEIAARLRFLLDVGLEYLTLDRSAPTLSGGESQRIRLASQIGSGLVGVLYVLDEPSIGLHPRDNRRLLSSLIRLRDAGNTIVVVEHDRDTMEVADQIVDFGPGPGVRGGNVVAQGGVREVASVPESLTGAYLSGRREIQVPPARRPVTRRPQDAPRPARPARTRGAARSRSR
jgi:excinuclease ABC subunit A